MVRPTDVVAGLRHPATRRALLDQLRRLVPTPAELARSRREDFSRREYRYDVVLETTGPRLAQRQAEADRVVTALKQAGIDARCFHNSVARYVVCLRRDRDADACKAIIEGIARSGG